MENHALCRIFEGIKFMSQEKFPIKGRHFVHQMKVLLIGENSCHKNKVTVTRKEFLSQKDEQILYECFGSSRNKEIQKVNFF